jgi:hypothetical protein
MKLAIPRTVAQDAIEKLEAYISARLPDSVQDKVRMNALLKGSKLILMESRPVFMDPSKWVDIPIAQFRYNSEYETWSLYWPDRNTRWHEDEDCRPSAKIDRLIRAVDEDVNCVYWG